MNVPTRSASRKSHQGTSSVIHFYKETVSSGQARSRGRLFPILAFPLAFLSERLQREIFRGRQCHVFMKGQSISQVRSFELTFKPPQTLDEHLYRSSLNTEMSRATWHVSNHGTLCSYFASSVFLVGLSHMTRSQYPFRFTKSRKRGQVWKKRTMKLQQTLQQLASMMEGILNSPSRTGSTMSL